MIELELKRIADALEKIVPCLVKLNVTAGPETSSADISVTLPPKPETEAMIPGEVKTLRSRQEIKQELDNLGIEYNDKLRTDSLEKILDKAKEERAAKDLFDTPVAPAAPAAPVEKKKEYTVPEAIEIAKRLASKFGADKTVSIITSYSCQTISQIAEKGQLQDFVAKVIAKEKEYESKN